EEIDQKEFSAYLDSIKLVLPGGSEEEYIKYAWESLVNEKLIASSGSDLGLTVTDEELKELETDSLNVSPYFKNLIEEEFRKYQVQFDTLKKQNPDDTTTIQYDKFFVDINGNFSAAKVNDYLASRPQWTPEREKGWSQLEDKISQERLASKYQTLIEKGMYTTKSELNERVWNADVKYVSIDYARLEEVEVTEEEISEYYNSNINLYQNEEETRNVEYVAFTVVPSKEDREKIQQDMILEGNKRSQDFVKNKDVDTDIYKKAEDIIDPNLTKLITNEEGVEAVEGAVEGPYELPNGSYRLAKLIKIENRPDSVKASHILLNIDEGDTITTISNLIDFAEDLKKQVENGADFGQLANERSKDEATKIKGGDLGWITEGQMVPASFNDSCFSSEPGDLKIVTTQFGVYLIKIDAVSDSTPEKYQIAYIDKEIVASTDTRDDYLWKAKTFLDLAKSQGLTQEVSEPKNKFLKYWWLFLDIGIIFILFYLYKKAGHESRYKRLMPYIGLFAILVTTIYGVYFNSTTEDDTTQLITDNKFHELFLSDSTGGAMTADTITISKMQFNIDGLDNPLVTREIIKWMYGIEKIEGKTVVTERKVGEVSNLTYECGDKFVVVSLSAINPKGNKTLKSVRDDIRGEIQTNKKFDAISSQLSGSPTLEEAASLFNTDTVIAYDVNFESKKIDNTITEALDVQNFVGAANAMDKGETRLIKGKKSAYVIKVDSKDSGTEYTEVKKAKIQQENSAKILSAVLEILKENSDIVDNRFDFY
ncbi:peptidylprolyl isomerase, partial [Flavobacteriales bacterium]|nr:peptidylprolyl isomerase [Flavobacteriales bacterium]